MTHSDVIIVGGGLVGASLALALDAHGLSSIILERNAPLTAPDQDRDGRASAISSASLRMLQLLGLGPLFADTGSPIRRILVGEGAQQPFIHFDAPDGTDPLGVMVPNALLRYELTRLSRAAKRVDYRAPAHIARIERTLTGVQVHLDDGAILRAPLLVAADGRRSMIREQAGVRVARWDYPHSGMVATITHEKNHDATAFEFFYPEGPFAVLPLRGGHMSCVVWSVARDAAPAWATLSPTALAAVMAEKMGGLLGDVQMKTPVATWPLGFHHAETYVAQRLALVGDAAHGIHPIAGQGLNLGLRDVAALAEVLVDAVRLGLDLGDAVTLARYQTWRRLDGAMVAGATDLLTRFFGAPGRLASRVRAAGLGVVERVSPLKSFFMAEARGEAGDLPKMLHGSLV